MGVLAGTRLSPQSKSTPRSSVGVAGAVSLGAGGRGWEWTAGSPRAAVV